MAIHAISMLARGVNECHAVNTKNAMPERHRPSVRRTVVVVPRASIIEVGYFDPSQLHVMHRRPELCSSVGSMSGCRLLRRPPREPAKV